MRWLKLICLGLFVLFQILLAGCAINPVSGKTNFVMMTEEQEIALGKKNHQKILEVYKPYKDLKLQKYINQLGHKLASSSHRSHLDYKFTLLDSPEVNAFALPGGHIYITRGILAYMNNEEELAGILGHEIGHVTARHSVRQHAQKSGLEFLGSVFAVTTGFLSAQAANLYGTSLVRGYSRQYELEADQLSAKYLASTGYNPEKILSVLGFLKDQEEFERKQAEKQGRAARVYHGVFSSHPQNDQRLQEAVKTAKKYTVPVTELTNAETFLNLLKGMTFGYREDQGILRGDNYYNKNLNLTMTFPKGWDLQNRPEQIMAVSPDGKSKMLLTFSNSKTNEKPKEFMRRKFPKLKDRQVLTEGAYTGVLLKNGKSIRLVSVQHQNTLLLVSGLASRNVSDKVFIEAALSIRQLNKEQLKLAKEQKIELIHAKVGDSFAKLASQIDLEPYAEEKLRLLNGMYQGGEPYPGQLIKIIR